MPGTRELKTNILKRIWVIMRHGRDPQFEHTYMKLDKIEAELRAFDEHKGT